jgi:hypothetical protein
MDNETTFSESLYLPPQQIAGVHLHIMISTCQQIAGVLEAENDAWNYETIYSNIALWELK